MERNELIQALWSNPDKMSEFKADPKQYLLNEGEPIPDDVQIVAHLDTLAERNFVLPEESTELPEGDDFVLNVLRKAQGDRKFKQELLQDTTLAIADEGYEIPDGITVNIHENTKHQLHVVIPFDPAQAELSDQDLEAVAGGKTSAKTDREICGGTSGGLFVGCAAAAFFSFGTTAAASVGGTAATSITSGSLAIAKS